LVEVALNDGWMPIIGLVKKASKKASENPNGMLTACPLRVKGKVYIYAKISNQMGFRRQNKAQTVFCSYQLLHWFLLSDTLP
jgi:hypothetical protein